jgi:hypothetical protein
METRFAYNPITKTFLECGECHSIALYNKGKQKQFDLYIRGIIKDKVLYLRLYYPFKDIDEKSYADIKEKSFDLLFDNKNIILANIEVFYGIKIKKVIYNAENDLLKGILTNI